MGNFTNSLKNFQSIPRALIFDNAMSDRARFVFCYMASKPEGWDFYLETMAKEIGYHVDTLRKYINELIKFGWLIKGEQVNDGKYGAVKYTLCSEKENTENTDTENTDTEKYRDGEIPPHIDKRDKRDKRDNINRDNKKKEIYKEIVDTWNNSTKSFAKVHVISEKIKSAINSRIRDGYSVDDIKKAILLCESLPDFYKGGDNSKAWKASFMWLISNTKGNFDSILSGALHNSPSAKRDYDMIINLGDKAYKEAYTPSCDGISLFWNDNINAYCTTNNPEWGVYDGYKPNERPNGATVYCQGVYYNWNSEKKEWKRKPLNHE